MDGDRPRLIPGHPLVFIRTDSYSWHSFAAGICATSTHLATSATPANAESTHPPTQPPPGSFGIREDWRSPPRVLGPGRGSGSFVIFPICLNRGEICVERFSAAGSVVLRGKCEGGVGSHLHNSRNLSDFDDCGVVCVFNFFFEDIREYFCGFEDVSFGSVFLYAFPVSFWSWGKGFDHFSNAQFHHFPFDLDG